jgi:hypothetical protein
VVRARDRGIHQMRAGNRHPRPSRKAWRTPSFAMPGVRFRRGAGTSAIYNACPIRGSP